MNKTDNDIKNIASQVSLSSHEKTDIWASIQKNKVTAAKPVATPFFHFLSVPSFRLASAFSVLIVGFFSLSALAEQSIPGSPLYAVKIAINEPLQESIAWTDEAKARTHIEISKDRIEDIKKAAALQETSEEELSVAIDSLADHSEEAIESIKDVSRGRARKDIETSVMLSTELSDTLETYGETSEDAALFATSEADTAAEPAPAEATMMMRAKIAPEEPEMTEEKSEHEKQLEEVEEIIETKKGMIRAYLEDVLGDSQ